MERRLTTKIQNYQVEFKNAIKEWMETRDACVTCEWDKNDPNWKWMNDLTTKELEVIIEQAVKLDRNERSKGLFSGKFRGVGE